MLAPRVLTCGDLAIDLPLQFGDQPASCITTALPLSVKSIPLHLVDSTGFQQRQSWLARGLLYPGLPTTPTGLLGPTLGAATEAANRPTRLSMVYLAINAEMPT